MHNDEDDAIIRKLDVDVPTAATTIYFSNKEQRNDITRNFVADDRNRTNKTHTHSKSAHEKSS